MLSGSARSTARRASAAEKVAWRTTARPVHGPRLGRGWRDIAGEGLAVSITLESSDLKAPVMRDTLPL